MTPRAPNGTKAPGRALWKAITEEFELGEHELVLLRQVVHTADLCADLQAIVDGEGVLLDRAGAPPRPHPAAVELRMQRVLLARLIVALRVPLGDEDAAAGGRTQVRALRGVYGLPAARS